MALELKELMGPNGLTYLLTKIQGMKSELMLKIAEKTDFSGNYDDLTNKPTIPTELPNPKALTFTGNATGSYDGSTAVVIDIPKEMELSVATESKLGGIMANPKEASDTVPVHIGTDEKLYVRTYPKVYMTQSDKDKLDEFDSADKYAKKTDIAAVYIYKGTLADESLLPDPEDVQVGWAYNLLQSSTYGNGSTVAWSGTSWNALGTVVDLSGYVQKSDMAEIGNDEIDSIWNTVFGGDGT